MAWQRTPTFLLSREFNGVRTLEPRVEFIESFSSRLLHGRGRFATKSPGLPGPCSFLLNFPEGNRRGETISESTRGGGGAPGPRVPKGPRRNEGRSGKMGGRQRQGGWKEEVVSTKHPIMTSLSGVC